MCLFINQRDGEQQTNLEDIMSANYTFSMIHIDGSVSSEMTFDEWVATHVSEQNNAASADEYSLVDGVIAFQDDVNLMCANEVSPKGRIW